MSSEDRPTATSSAAEPFSLYIERFQSPDGFLVYPRLDVPDRRFDPQGTFSAGIHLSTAELAAVEADLRRVYAVAYPDDTADLRLPLWRHPDGPLTLFVKSSTRPKIIDDRRRPLVGVQAGARVRIIGTARPYRYENRRGVTVYVNTLQAIALEARDPRRERKRAEQEALRQAVAMARAGKGSR